MLSFTRTLKHDFSGSTVKAGKTGEDLAVQYLLKKKCVILQRNYRRRSGEIDIVVKDGLDLVFVEVKTRRSHSFGTPFEAVSLKKQRQISKVALVYLTEHNFHDQPIRFDVIAISVEGKKAHVELLKNAFEYCG
ncbi:MAG: YraN family protein [Desulfobulbus sp.]|nr:MAG: YraN family protein [Desulfobulbus sp.]RUM35861.1 MAG: YraN family protein [Desulfobulbus sp.]RUM41021.1 MAG: YraN family protein [Desulfobulbus sp.]